MRRVTAAFALIALGFGVPLACRAPTEMTIDVSLFGDLDCSDVGSVAIIARKDRESAEQALRSESYTTEVAATDCRDGHLGTLVITPDGASGAVVVAVHIGTTDRCAPPSYLGCIVARRAFEFVGHRPLFLPITLEARCIDVPCDAASSCRATKCFSSAVSCADDGTCVSEAEPKTDGDGGSVLPDGQVIDTPPPLGDGGGDNGTDGSVPNDSGNDGSTDAGPDGAVNDGVGTDTCFTMPASQDCFETNQRGCCDPPSHEPMCLDIGMCKGGGSSFYPCTGRKHCAPNQVCCAAPGSAAVVVRSTCADDCPESSGAILCNDDTDCPPPMACSALYVPVGGTQRKSCAIP